MSPYPPHQTLRFTGSQSTFFLNSLFRSPPSDWQNIRSLDLSDVDFITPVICVLTGIAQSRNWEIIYPRTHDTNSYLSYMLRASFESRCDRYIPFTNCKESSEVRSLVASIKDIVARWVPRETAEDFDYSLHEAMNNVFDHAESLDGFWIHAQKYPEKRLIEIVIADSGIGISESLRQNPTYSRLSTIEGFTKALELQITSKPKQNAGEGLSSILEWIKFNQNTGARGLVISKDNVWYCGQTQNGITNRSSIVWPGTFVWLCVPFIMENSLEDVWGILGLDSE